MKVLTGDKQETAINIGYSCQLLTDELVDVFIVDAATYDEVHQQLLKFKENIRIVHTFHPQSPATGAANGTSTPPQQMSPPAVSVVTFRWDEGCEGNTVVRAR